MTFLVVPIECFPSLPLNILAYVKLYLLHELAAKLWRDAIKLWVNSMPEYALAVVKRWPAP